MNGHEADSGVIDGIARTLRNASTQLDRAGKSTPDTPDAGDATPALAAVLAQLSDNAGQMVLGLVAAGDSVATASSRYAEDDAAAREEFTGAKAERGMPIDTEIKGNVESIRSAANWVRDSLASGITDAVSQIYAARNSADAGWRGEAAEAFRAEVTAGARKG
ncbi:MAG: hypothetical protein GEU86_09560 [Actinophytocola sp.]|nr:hypothetical protein [Actinophytocola sp.]